MFALNKTKTKANEDIRLNLSKFVLNPNNFSERCIREKKINYKKVRTYTNTFTANQ